MSKSPKAEKTCYICHRGFGVKRDKDLFVEVNGIAACKRHPGVEKWYKESVKSAGTVPESPVVPA